MTGRAASLPKWAKTLNQSCPLRERGRGHPRKRGQLKEPENKFIKVLPTFFARRLGLPD